jgi:hypothetical protein
MFAGDEGRGQPLHPRRALAGLAAIGGGSVLVASAVGKALAKPVETERVKPEPSTHGPANRRSALSLEKRSAATAAALGRSRVQ